ncbi:MAG: hypothetical protein VXZ38_08055 [Planctomycetota bacterium]|nr:hypothetical protein [Planctomycetota bacterium]
MPKFFLASVHPWQGLENGLPMNEFLVQIHIPSEFFIFKPL